MYQARKTVNTAGWEGVYFGTLPCSDCDGIETIITLRANFTYSIETQYLGRSNEASRQNGTFSWNSLGTVIMFGNLNRSVPMNFLVLANGLKQLDAVGKPMKGGIAEDYVLKKDTTGILEIYWKLISINGRAPVSAPDNKREAHFNLKAIGGRISGNSGCNSFSGSYTLPSAGRLALGPLASTRMACLENMKDEADFFSVLGGSVNYQFQGDTLVLFDDERQKEGQFIGTYVP
jgi:heat shock protein HslJ